MEFPALGGEHDLRIGGRRSRSFFQARERRNFSSGVGIGIEHVCCASIAATAHGNFEP